MAKKVKRDWKSLEKKLGAAWPLDEAADACGIPRSEAAEWAKDNLAVTDDTDIQIKQTAHAALKASVQKLTEVMADGPRESCAEIPILNTDVDAAKALARIAVDTLKLCKTSVIQKKAGDNPLNPDLFDLQGVYGCWKLKDPNQI